MDFDDGADNIWARPSPPVLVNGSSDHTLKQLPEDATSTSSVQNNESGEHLSSIGKRVAATFIEDDAWNHDGEDEDADSGIDKLQEDARKLKLNGTTLHDEPDSYEDQQRHRAHHNLANAGPSIEFGKDVTFSDAEAGPSSPRLSQSLTVDSRGGQFDDFPDDNADDFGNFDEPVEGGANGDDFGDFDEADTTVSFSFTKSSPPPAINVPPDRHHVASVTVPRINLNGSPSFEDVLSQMQAVFEHDHPGMFKRIDRKTPARRVEGLAQVLTTEADRSIFQFLNSEPDVKPFSWKSSQTRMRMMRSLGVPINLDDFAPASQPMPSLVLPSVHTTSLAPNSHRTLLTAPQARHVIGSRSTSPANGYRSGSAASNGRTPSRESELPPFRLDRCKELVAMSEEELSLRTTTQLEVLREELQKEAVAASTHLTQLLEKKEVLTGQNETYNAMIQDLAMTAQKMRSTSSAAGVGRKPSLRRTGSQSKLAPSAIGTAKPGPSSLGNSRPNSPALSSSQNARIAAVKESPRRSSLW